MSSTACSGLLIIAVPFTLPVFTCSFRRVIDPGVNLKSSFNTANLTEFDTSEEEKATERAPSEVVGGEDTK